MMYKISNLRSDTKESEIKKLEDAMRRVNGVTHATCDPKAGSIDVSHGTSVKASALKEVAKTVGFELREPK